MKCMLNNEQSYTATTHGIMVSVIPLFNTEKSSLTDSIFFWDYMVEIENHREDVVMLISRYWKIISQQGEVQEVEGDGVVGKQPVIKPREEFTYASSAILSFPSGVMHGHYVFNILPSNKTLSINIPLFSLDSPYFANKDS